MTRCPIHCGSLSGICNRELYDCPCHPCPMHDGFCSSCPFVGNSMPGPAPHGRAPARVSRDKPPSPLRIELCTDTFTRDYNSSPLLPDAFAAGRFWSAMSAAFGLAR